MRKELSILSNIILMLSVFLSTVSFAVVPEEGMFTPDQIDSLNLRQKGLKIRPIDIYNPNGVDISDAIMRVNIAGGGFGTGEFVSPNGLILTNHHVAFDALVNASTPGKDYGGMGYRAASQANELPAEGYNLLITNRIENVTAKILRGTEALTGDARQQAVKRNIENLQSEEQKKAAAGLTIRIQELNSGYYYYLYETMQIKDVRVVYAPPRMIGFFGGDPDNFEWSRHTGDFTFLRAYVAPNGQSAEYSPSNVPYKPKKHLTISLGGVNENDFVFVLGYPGGTTRYRESQSVEYAENVNFPFLRDYLKAWTGALEQVAAEDEEKRIKLQGEIDSLNNAEKVYEGGAIALRRGDTVSRKRDQETKFATWVAANQQRQTKYGEVIPRLQSLTAETNATAMRDRVLRTFPSAGATPLFKQFYDAVVATRQNKKLTTEKRTEIQNVFQNYEPTVEREVMKFFLKAAADLPANQKFQTVETLFERFDGKERRAAEETLVNSLVENKELDTAEELVKLYDMSFENLRQKYPNLVALVVGMEEEKAQITGRTNKFNAEIDRLRLLYQQGMAEMNRTTPYPDANASLRFSYGRVKGYSPREAVVYQPFTTLKGVIEKDTNEFPFDVPEELKALQRTKDFGRYGVGDSVPVNFLATTDIIGGNSGSPILNAMGEQVGIVFDGNYEGLGNDIFYNPDYGRTIAVDIRYVLFVTEKVGNAGWILNEMTIKGRAAAATQKR